MDEMVLEPTEGVGAADAATASKPNPWTERGNSSTTAAWFKSVGKILVEPHVFGTSLQPSATLKQALIFCAISVGLEMVLTVLCATPGAMFLLFGGMGGPIGGAGAGGGTGTLVASRNMLLGTIGLPLIAVPLYRIIFIPIMAGWMHLMARLGGAAYGFGRTMQVALYCEGGSSVLSAIPCIQYLSRLWWSVSAAFMLQRAQRCHWSAAVLAVIPGILLALAMTAVTALTPMMGMMGGLATARMLSGQGVGSVGPASSGNPDFASVAGALSNAIEELSRTGGNVMNLTPLDLIADGDLAGESLFAMIAPTGTTSGIGQTPQSEILFGAGRQSVRDESARLRARLPANNAPFRIGQAAFCYRGMTPAALRGAPRSTREPWLVVVMTSDSSGSMTAMSATTERLISVAEWAEALAAENVIRGELGLPPLPDLTQVPDVYSGIVPNIPDALPDV